MSEPFVNMHEAKSRLSELVRQVEQGHRVTIARDGVAVARLEPIPGGPRTPGTMAGTVLHIGDDFELDDAELDEFETAIEP